MADAGEAGGLVEAVRRGDIAAYGALYSLHVGAVQTVVRSHIHDRAHAEDVVQDVFARALESLDRLDDAARFRPWLLSIARHTAIDARRRVARSPVSAGPDGDAPEQPGGVDPEERAEVAELADLVWGAVAGLSQRDATAMALVALGFGIADVAIAFGVTHNAAKVAVHRARERARSALLQAVLVRKHAPWCASIDPAADVVVVAKHLRTCTACRDAARSAL
jgi:RNA polymerase sigma factor (sigma-70 family)